MRVTNNLIYGQSSRAISSANERYLDIQKKVAEQTSIVSPSDNPVGASQVLHYDTSNAELKNYDNNMKMAKGHLEYEEVALQSFNGLLDDARTLLVQADNSAHTYQDIKAITDQVSAMTDSMEDLMNSKSADGSYIFSGTDTNTPAFVHLPDGTFKWSGNEGQKFAQISDNRKIPIGDSGKEIFENVWTRNTFDANLKLGNVKMSSQVSNQDDFDDFLKKNYRALDANHNSFVLTTTPLSMKTPDTAALTALVNQASATTPIPDEKKDADYHYDGPPGRYFLADTSGNVIATGTYNPNKDLIIHGMSFSLKGDPGAIVDVNLNKPRRDNVVNVLRDSIRILKNSSSDSSDDDQALKNAQESIKNTQTSIGNIRSKLGARLNTLSERGDFSSANTLANTMAQDRIAGLDIGKAATELSMSENALDASQKLFSRVNNLSLFNKI